MKYIQTYESISKPYKDGDYAIVKISTKGTIYEVLVKFMQINNYRNNDIKIEVLSHFNIFNKDTMYLIQPYQIICWSENKKELELLMDTKRYNI